MLSYQAHSKVHNAVLGKKLVRPDKCSRCGAVPGWRTTADGRTVPGIEAHHEDYEKPFEVEWLCRKCHAKETYDSQIRVPKTNNDLS
jgi:ribosomal protein L40E